MISWLLLELFISDGGGKERRSYGNSEFVELLEAMLPHHFVPGKSQRVSGFRLGGASTCLPRKDTSSLAWLA